MSDYKLADAVSETAKRNLSEYEPLLQQLLYNRGVETMIAAQIFLEPDYDTQLHDPLLLHDMQAAVDRILRALEACEHIYIFSDYDCDGIPGGVVFHDFFRAIKYEHFSNYIPHRHYEGFGLSHPAIDKMKSAGAALIITIDCGTSSVAEVAYANSLGIDVVITDHHEPGQQLPEAIAVVNPKVGDTYPFTGLCGTGVIFKVIQALIAQGNFGLKPGWEKWWLDLVGVATIADMVPLVDENRVFVTYGLQVLRKSRRPGLQALLKKARTDQRYLTEEDVGFTIGPRINAASRMDTPEDAFYMLAETDVTAATERVVHLEKLNTDRKGKVATMSKELHKRIDGMTEIPPVLVLGNPDWRPSLVGLAAGKLAELHNRPAFIWGRDGNGVIKGSCRSGGNVSIVKIMNAVDPKTWLEFGGHHQAGGFSVDDVAIHTLSDVVNTAYAALGKTAIEKTVLSVDADLTLADIHTRTLQILQKVGPYGMANPKPLFRIRNASPSSVELFGKTKEHTKIIFDRDTDTLEAITFFMTPEQFTVTPVVNTQYDFLVHIEESFFMGRRSLRLRIVDIINT